MSFQTTAFRQLSRYTGFQGKSILEIGGNESLESAIPFFEAGAAKIVVSGLGHINSEGSKFSGKIEIVKADGHQLQRTFGSNSFDIIYGLSIIEHIPMPANFLEQVFYVLKPGGFAFFEGNPIWTSAKGHHLWVRTPNRNYLFNDRPDLNSINPIPDYAHLLKTAKELSEMLRIKNIPEADIDRICWQIYESNHINRLSHFEISTSYSNCPLVILDTGLLSVDVPSNILEQLRAIHGDFNDYGVQRLKYVLYKK